MHYESNKCRLEEEKGTRQETLQHCFEARQVLISTNAESLEPAATYPYLGRIVDYTNSNWEDLYHNLRKAQRRWGMAAKMATKTGATVQARGML